MIERDRTMQEKQYTLEDLKSIVATLRAPNGCPWDREQTHESLKPCLIEEAYEVLEGIDQSVETGDDENLCEELGDLLLQVLMHTQIAEEENRFSFQDVVQGISEKLIRRHPHVFGTKKADTSEEGLKNWEEIKKKEKENRPIKGELASVPKAFPALLRAQKVQKKAKKEYGYQYSLTDSIDLLKSNLDKLKNEDMEHPSEAVKEEIEQVLFETANISSFFKENAEISLTNAVEKFINKHEGVKVSYTREKDEK